MSDIKLGSIITGPANRDAIHVALAPVVAAATERLQPAQHVGLIDSETATANGPHVGIVDPFLTGPVMPGERFYLMLYQNTVTGMRHEWRHPAFDAFAISRARIRIGEIAAGEGMDEEAFMAIASAGVAGEYYRLGSDIELPGDFWANYEIVTGKKVKPSDQVSAFRCSC